MSDRRYPARALRPAFALASDGGGGRASKCLHAGWDWADNHDACPRPLLPSYLPDATASVHTWEHLCARRQPQALNLLCLVEFQLLEEA